MYGINKLYIEQLGAYCADHFRQLDEHKNEPRIDFRCLRFPGLISPETLPTGGTSDYCSEMLHAAARGQSYDCFVRPDTRIPFMVMDDAISALIALAEAEPEKLSRRVYNVTGFSVSADEIRRGVLAHFPEANLGFAPGTRRQAIVDSWPNDIDDSLARRDWGWAPKIGSFEDALSEVLIPRILAQYGISKKNCANL